MRLLPTALMLALVTGASAQPASVRADAEGRLIRAMTEHYLGNDSAAVRHLGAALGVVPGDGAVLDALAESYESLGRTTDALYYAGRAAQAAPGEAAATARLGALQARVGQRAEARSAFEQARRLDPTDAETLVALADLYAADGDAARERGALEDLVAVGETPAAYLRLSVLYEAAGESARATEALRAALRLAPSDPTLSARLGEAVGTAPAQPAVLPPAGALTADAALAIVSDDPRRLDAWEAALAALAAASDPRASATADEATLLFPTVPAVLAGAAEAYLSAGRARNASDAARRGLAALDTATAPEDDLTTTSALRSRLDRALAAATR